ncbi:MAG: hypothetical protein KAR57_09170, partial [Bacteroidales bacterium]|nr:hypothetical protein [Bacteroidales bacterium]
MYLSLDQFQIIERDVQGEGITYSHLEYDLLDHVCCDIEDRMSSDISFDDAYEAVKLDVGLQGLRRVQEETLLLINKNYRMMKKSMKTLGTIALAGVSIAAIAKIMHWPGASLLILLSTFVVSTIFFPAALYVWYKEVFLKKHGFIVILTFFAGFTFMYGTLFKIQHWPFANILLIIGELLTIITIIIGGITYLISKPTSKDRKGLLVIGIIGLVGFSLGTLFKIQHWPGASILLLLGSILLFSVFLPIYAYNTYKGETTIKNSFIFSVFALMFIITFTFLLTIKSSQSILVAYTYRVNELHSSISVTENLIKDIPEMENSVEINQKANMLFKSITDLKNDLVNISGGTDIKVNHLKIEDLKYLKKSAANKTYIDLLEGNMQNGKAYLLYNDIQKYKSFIINGLGNHPYSANLISKTLLLSQDNPQDWIRQNFYQVPLVTSLNNLSQIQLDIRLVQQEALNNMNLA